MFDIQNSQALCPNVSIFIKLHFNNKNLINFIYLINLTHFLKKLILYAEAPFPTSRDLFTQRRKREKPLFI